MTTSINGATPSPDFLTGASASESILNAKKEGIILKGMPAQDFSILFKTIVEDPLNSLINSTSAVDIETSKKEESSKTEKELTDTDIHNIRYDILSYDNKSNPILKNPERLLDPQVKKYFEHKASIQELKNLLQRLIQHGGAKDAPVIIKYYKELIDARIKGDFDLQSERGYEELRDFLLYSNLPNKAERCRKRAFKLFESLTKIQNGKDNNYFKWIAEVAASYIPFTSKHVEKVDDRIVDLSKKAFDRFCDDAKEALTSAFKDGNEDRYKNAARTIYKGLMDMDPRFGDFIEDYLAK